jgi:hypothetical protein
VAVPPISVNVSDREPPLLSRAGMGARGLRRTSILSPRREYGL